MLKPVLGGVASVVYFITGYEQTPLNKVIFFSLLYFLLLNDPTIQNLLIDRDRE